MGSFELPTFSKSHHHGAGFHGSPVEANARKALRSWRSKGARTGEGTLVSPPPLAAETGSPFPDVINTFSRSAALPNGQFFPESTIPAATGSLSIYRSTLSKC